MNDKRKDLLIAYAFGDLTEEEMAEIETTAADRAEVDRLAQLRADLKQLNRVPECQLSVERVRDAILNREIRQRRDWRPWGIAAPVAAALALGAFLLTRPSGEAPVTPSIVADKAETKPFVVRREPDLVSSPPITGAEVERLVEETLAVLGTSVITDDVPVRPTRSDRVRPTARRRPIPASLVAKTEPPKASTPAETPRVAAATTQPQPIEPIVMISNDEDQATGARKANEVETSNDVVIGG